MNPLIQLKTITLPLFIAVALGCFALLPRVQAAPDPAPPPGANTRDGAGAMANITTGNFNTAFGTNALFSLATGQNNSAQGNSALFSCINGSGNSAIGSIALRFLTSGNHNVAVGNTALNNVTTGSRNTAVGYGTARSGNFSNNTAVGWSAIISATTGGENVAVGAEALASNTTGNRNVAIGFQALANNTTSGNASNAVGYQALFSQTTGQFNNGFGWNALFDNVSGDNNTAMGDNAGGSITGSDNSVFGREAGSVLGAGSGNVCIGAAVFGVPGVNDTTWIKNVNTTTQNFSAGVNNYVTVRLSDGRLGNTAVVSSRRYKEEIKPLAAASQALFALKPVSFRLKKEFDPTQALGFGLIAEDVEKVDPNLVYRNDKGQVESVRYEMVNAMLLNEFLKEHRKVQEQEASITELKFRMAKQEAIIAEQQKGMEALAVSLKDQAAEIQKVSAQLAAASPSYGGLELNKFATGRIRRGGPAPRTVLNNP